MSQGLLSSNCGYCPQAAHTRNYAARGDRRMSLATFEACLANVPSHVQVMFAGMAEPWLNPDATAMAESAIAAGRRLSACSSRF